MSEIFATKQMSLLIGRAMRNFTKKIGAKDEPLIWGLKANEDVQEGTVSIIEDCVDRKKVYAVKVLREQVPLLDGKSVLLKGISKGTVVFIPNAESWDQDVLLRVAIQSSELGSKALLGFSDPSRLSMGIYQFLVTQQVSDGYELSKWAINMSIPICDIR